MKLFVAGATGAIGPQLGRLQPGVRLLGGGSEGSWGVPSVAVWRRCPAG
jgi:hypothetical protein